MATEILSGPIGEVKVASSVDGGTSLSTSIARIVLPLGTKQVELIPRNYSTAVVVQYQTCPWLTVLKTTDLLATNLTDYSVNAQDNDVATDVTLSSLGTLAQSDALYVGSHIPFAGVVCDIDSANGNASVLTVAYWDGSAWTSISATDGTDSGGASMGTDGSVTWTIPAAWTTAGLKDSVATAAKNQGILTEPLFWTRWVFSAALDSSTTLNSMISIARQAAPPEIPSGFAKEFACTVGPGGISAIEALTDAGTASLIVNCTARGRFQ